MSETYKSETLEHLGLVAGMFDELGISELVDALVPQDLEQRRISVGQALKAMVLNGKTLHQHGARVPDQKGKPTQRPTARWVFELFLDVHLLTIMMSTTALKTLVLNLQDELRTLLVLLGRSYADIPHIQPTKAE